jgi:hypothetical protein
MMEDLSFEDVVHQLMLEELAGDLRGAHLNSRIQKIQEFTMCTPLILQS